jgi:hypothetical protein
MSHYHPEDFEHLNNNIVRTNEELAIYHKSELTKHIKGVEFHKKEHLKYMEILKNI